MSYRRHRGRSILLVVTLVAASVFAGAAPAMAAPPNDNRAAAQTLTGNQGVAYGTLAGSTIESGTCPEPAKNGQWPPIYGDHSVWFRWTVPANGWLRVGMTTYGGWTGYLTAFRNYPPCSWAPEAGASSAPGHIGQIEVYRGESIWLSVYSVNEPNPAAFAIGWRLIARPAPLNDRFATPDVLWGRYGVAGATNVNATKETGEPAHAGRPGGHSVWFQWTAVESGPAMFHLGGPSTPLDCLLAVYTGTAISTLTPVASDSGTWAGDSCTARFAAVAGVTYRIAVDGDNGDEKKFEIFWNSGQPPAHDDAVNAKVISGFSGYLDDTNRGATDELTEPRHPDLRGGSSLWYRWTAPDDGRAHFGLMRPALHQYPPDSEFEEFKRIAVFTGAPPGGLTLLGQSPVPPVAGGELSTEVTVAAGTTYWLQVVGVDEEAVHYTLDWTLRPQSNDEFAEPVVLPATGTVAANTTDATAEPGEPSHFRYPARRSLWFQWTAPQTGQVTFHDHGFVIQPALAAYTGDRIDALTRVPITREFIGDGHYRFSFGAVAGVTYRLALDEDDPFAYGGAHRLNWSFGAEDTTPPAVAMTEPAQGARVSGVTRLAAAVSDASGPYSAWYSHALDASAYNGPQPMPAPYAVDFDTERYRDGPLELTAYALDTQGNRGESAPRTMVIENRPPAVAVWWSPPDDLTASTDAHLEWDADEPLSRSMCSLDGAAYEDCSNPLPGRIDGSRDYHGLSDGVHVFRVVTTDAVGKVSVDPDARQWIVDTKGLGVPLIADAAAPTVTAPVTELVTGTVAGSSTAPVRVRWTSTDGSGTGVDRHDVQVSVNGGAYASTSSPGSATSAVYQLGSATYRYRVRATDRAGNASDWAYGSSFSTALKQENSALWRWSAGWTRTASTAASGGYYRWTSTSGASAKLTFRGRSVALYGPRSTAYGQSAIYLDGVRVATINQWSAASASRQPLYVRNGLSTTVSHTIEVRRLGTAGHTGGGTRIAVDAAMVLS